MNDERLGEEDIAARSDTIFGRRVTGYSICIGRRDFSVRVRAERKLETTIAAVGGIEVNAGEQHMPEQFDRRLGVPNAGLVGPVGETRCFNALA